MSQRQRHNHVHGESLEEALESALRDQADRPRWFRAPWEEDDIELALSRGFDEVTVEQERSSSGSWRIVMVTDEV